MQLCAAGPIAFTKRVLLSKRIGGISAMGDDPSASRDPDAVWNIGEPEWAALSQLEFDYLARFYIFSRLQVSARILYPEKRISPLLMPWVLALRFKANRRTFGIRTRLGNWMKGKA
jgi:hypothetical protein